MIRRTSLAALLLLTSCSILKPLASSPIPPQHTQHIRNTPREIAITKSVGETMVDFGGVTIFPGFVAKEDFKFPIKILGMPSTSIPKGTKWTCNRYVLTDHYWCSGHPWDIATDRSGVILGIFTSDGRFIKFDKSIDGKIRPVDILTEGLYKQGLIYNGKSKDTIRLSYREYSNGMARPAFYQELIYDLLESREIAFRDLRIEVLEATNSAIKFIVKE